MGIRLVVDLEQLRALESQLRIASDGFLHGIQPARVVDGAAGLNLGGKEILDALALFNGKWVGAHKVLHDRHQKLADFVSQATEKYAETEGVIERATKT